MAKYHGDIGFSFTTEEQIDGSGTGVWRQTVVERHYRGDLLDFSADWNQREEVNPDLSLENRVSIIGDDFAYANYGTMLYAVIRGVPWRIRSIKVEWPRLILSIGGVYNGERPTRAS